MMCRCDVCFDSIYPAQALGAYRPNWTTKGQGWYGTFTYLASELDDPNAVRL